MTEERYIKITSCKNCEFNGHTATITRENKITHFCINSENMKIEQLPLVKMGNDIYPITSVTKSSNDSPIPYWCKLPSKIL